MKRALLVIDAQKIYASEESAYYVEGVATILGKINQLIDSFRLHDELVIYIKQVNKPDGSDSGRMYDFAGEGAEVEFQEGSIEVEYIDGLSIIENSPTVIKTRYDAFINTNLDALLKENGIDKVVVCGFMTNFCCESTARHAHDIDYYVDFVIDAMGTPGTEELSPSETSKATVATIESGFAVIVNADDIT